jgi:hypothetical protein
MAKKKWIQEAIKKPGSFTAQAKKAGTTVLQFSRRVAGNPNRYNTVTRKRAALAQTLSKMRKKK